MDRDYLHRPSDDGPDVGDEERPEDAPLTDSELFAKALHDLAVVQLRRAAIKKARADESAFLAATVPCPVCKGRGHGALAWDECRCCGTSGRVTPAEAAEIRSVA